MRFKIFAVGAALVLAATTIYLSQAGAQTTGTIELEQTAAKVTMIAGGCDTGTVSFTLVLPDGTIETVNGTSIGTGRFSHLIEIGTTTQTGDYSVVANCKKDADTLVTYEQKSFTIGAASAQATATPAPEASPTPVTDPTPVPTETGTNTTTMSLTASTETLPIGKNAVLTMTGCPENQPAEGDVYRAALEITNPLGISETMTDDYAGNSTHELVFATSGTTQPGNHTIVGLCEKKAGDAWAEVHRYATVTINVSGVSTDPTPATGATPAPTVAPGTGDPSPIGFTG